MPHIFERAPSARSKCRGCGQPTGKDEVRFGERLPNAFGDGEMTLWQHPDCAAYRRPGAEMEAAAEYAEMVDVGALQSACETSLASHRICRVGSAERALSGRAGCRACRELIAKNDWRTPLIFFEDGMFGASGFAHVGCLSEYCEGEDFLPVLLHFAVGLSTDEKAEITKVASSA